MRKIAIISLVVTLSILGWQCTLEKSKNMNQQKISDNVIKEIIDTLKQQSEFSENLIEKGVTQAAQLWDTTDGTAEEFKQFCLLNFARTKESKEQLFNILSQNFEVLFGYFNKITVELMKPLHLTGRDIMPIDEMFGGYSVSAHLIDDFFTNKIAFVTILNFPAYSLKEKNELGKNWTRLEWHMPE